MESIVTILLYIAMLFASPDTDRISISSSGPGETTEWTRSGASWEAGDGNKKIKISQENKTLIFEYDGQRQKVALDTEVAGISADHDWNKTPKVTWRITDTLEKTATGFTARINDGKPGMEVYQITYHRADAEKETIEVNVLGHVKQPGVYQIAVGSGVMSGLTAAGGYKELGHLVQPRILRGEGGAVPKVTEVSWDILNPEEDAWKLQDHDTLYFVTRNR